MSLLDRMFFFDRWVARTGRRWYLASERRRTRANYHLLRAIGIRFPADDYIEVLKMAFHDLAYTIGTKLLPVFQRFGESLAFVTAQFQNFASEEGK